jgi:hypothetical protein
VQRCMQTYDNGLEVCYACMYNPYSNVPLTGVTMTLSTQVARALTTATTTENMRREMKNE